MNNDIFEREGFSNCCGAKVYRDYGMCSNCKEYCETLFEEEDPAEVVWKNEPSYREHVMASIINRK